NETQYQVSIYPLVEVGNEFIFMILYPFVLLAGNLIRIILSAERTVRGRNLESKSDIGTTSRVQRHIDRVARNDELKVQVVAVSVGEVGNQRVILKAVIIVLKTVVENKIVIWPA